MTEDRWEYCLLTLWHTFQRGPDWYSNITVQFLGAQGGHWPLSLTTQEDRDAKPWPFNPWGLAVAKLGEGGWELVTVQHANNRGAMDSSLSMVSHANATAYFKRRQLDGRLVTEPFPVLRDPTG